VSRCKTSVPAAAVAEGVDPDSTTYNSHPFVYQPDPASEPWEVRVYDEESYLGSTSISRATLASDNTVFAQLTLDLGPAGRRRAELHAVACRDDVPLVGR